MYFLLKKTNLFVLLIIDYCNLCSVVLPEYFMLDYGKDFICSKPFTGGITKCNELPPSRYIGQLCNGSLVPGITNLSLYNNADQCINWNQYYTTCKAGMHNPFKGAISFDNIGLAWVAIFQVSFATYI